MKKDIYKNAKNKSIHKDRRLSHRKKPRGSMILISEVMIIGTVLTLLYGYTKNHSIFTC